MLVLLLTYLVNSQDRKTYNAATIVLLGGFYFSLVAGCVDVDVKVFWLFHIYSMSSLFH